MPTETLRCKRCGWCCSNIVINIAYSDIVRWLSEDRKDILQQVSFIDNYPRKNTGGFFIAKTTFNPKQPCPFLHTENNGLTTCVVYETRPVACRDFPYGRDIQPLTSKNCAMCPEPHFIFDKKIRKEIQQRQYKDFKMAFDNRRTLLDVLIQERNE